jgi:hypothetical protein
MASLLLCCKTSQTDRLSLGLLFQKLKTQSNISSAACRLIGSFLGDRKQSVVKDDEMSQDITID